MNEKFYYIGNIPNNYEDIKAIELVILGTVKEQRVLYDGRMVVELKEGVSDLPNAMKDFESYNAKDILTEIDKIENTTE